MTENKTSEQTSDKNTGSSSNGRRRGRRSSTSQAGKDKLPGKDQRIQRAGNGPKTLANTDNKEKTLAKTDGKGKTLVKQGDANQARQGRGARKSSKPSMRIIPLGGMDGIGKNMTAFECCGDIIVVDAGLMFPDDDHLGVDLILPDYTFVLENADKLRGIFITHGHEDHTGALPYLLKDLGFNPPIYGSKLTLGFIEGKLKEHRINNPDFHEISGGSTVQLGCFSVSSFTVNHSIPGSLGLFIKTPAGTVFHTGDFKLDQTPIDGVHTDYASISHFGHMGVDLMMSDSTNAQRKTFTPSEATAGVALNRIIKDAKRRVIVASFSSHIHRVQQVCDAAAAAGRRVAVTGRSMLTNTKIARDLGYLHVDDDLLIDAYEAMDIPPEKVVVLCTGSQGEPLSALARMANGEHRTIEIEEGDTVIISATPVPGNEKAVTRVINSLSKIGAIVYDKSNAAVHVSGHAGSEELKIMLTMVNPTNFMPVHGEAAHLRAHACLANSVGIPNDRIFVVDNGDSLILQNHKVKRGPSVESGVIFVDGLSVGDTDQVVLRDRQVLANDGMATVVVMIDGKTRKPVGDAELIMRGVSGGDEKALLDDAHRAIKKALADCTGKRGAQDNAMQRAVREALSHLLWERCHRRPMILPIIMEV